MKTVKILIVTTILFALLSSLSFSAMADSEEIITDDEDDVIEFPFADILGETDDESDFVTTDQKPNLDITKVTYMKEDQSDQVTIVLEVNSDGIIEDRDDLGFYDESTPDDMNLTGSLITYSIELQTSETSYILSYLDGECLLDSVTPINYTKDGSILSIMFALDDADETFVSMSASAIEIEIINILTSEAYYYFDYAPNDALFVAYATATPETANVGKSINFSVEISELDAMGLISGPYSYEWNFDDGSTSTQQNPVHSYAYAGTYQASVTVEDGSGQTTEAFVNVTIEKGSSGNGDNNNDNGDSQNDTPGFEILTLVAAITVGSVLLYIKRRR